jgi:hypothetical protein
MPTLRPRPDRRDIVDTVAAVAVRRVALLLVPALVPALVVAAGCGWGGTGRDEPRDGLGPDTARFTYGERQVEVSLTSCGHDEEEDVVLLAGREGAIVLQAAADVGEGGAERTGVTADLGTAGILGAFGADLEQGPAGEITEVRTDGDRLIVEGEWVPLDGELEPLPEGSGPAEPATGELRARCSEDATAAPVAPAAPVGPRS